MFGVRPKPSVPEDIRVWIEAGFKRLNEMLGQERMLAARVILPTDEFFPDRFDGSSAGVEAMAKRVAGYMGVAAGSYTVHVYAENEDTWRENLPVGLAHSSDAAGLYFHEPDGEPHVVGVHADKLKDPLALAGVLAHELAHVLLLGSGRLQRDAVDMEPLTDLCTVFLGMGVFTAGSAFQFNQWTDAGMQGWRTSRQGYLPEPVWGYALAYFAARRQEAKPGWAKHLPGNIRSYFDQSRKWLAAQPQ